METTNNTNATELQSAPQTIIFKKEEPQRNGIGTAGFVLSITGLILCWVPILKWLLLIPSIILSLIGMTKYPRTLALIGATISGLLIIILVLVRKISFWGALLSL